MKKATATATTKDGILTIHNRKLFNEQIRQFSNGRCLVTVQRVYNKRSNPQNAYYHAVVIPMVCDGLRQQGHDVNIEDTHEILKGMFNKEKFVNTSTGEVDYFGGSTTKLSTIEMMEYIKRIQQFASEYLNVFIPDPI
jgi:hypothetical protein